jgi:hypothetical protein
MPETAFTAALPHGSIALQRLVDDLMAYKIRLNKMQVPPLQLSI